MKSPIHSSSVLHRLIIYCTFFSQVISWVPLDETAKILIEMRNSERLHLHLVHPRPVSWSVLADVVSSTIGIPLVPYAEWLTLLEKHDKSDGATASSIPATKILPFFQGVDITTEEAMGFPRLGISGAEEVSEIMRGGGVRGIDAGDVERWLDDWKIRHFLD